MSATAATRRAIAHIVKTHFTIVDKKGKCQYCEQLISMPGNSASNLRRHLASKHPTVSLDDKPVSRSRSSSTDAEVPENVSGEGSSEIPAFIADEASYSVPEDNLAPPSRHYSPTWNHFIRFGRKAKCRYCSRLLATSNGSSSNLKRHLKANHPTVLLDFYGPGRQQNSPAEAEAPEENSNEPLPLMINLSSEDVQPPRKKNKKTQSLPDEAQGAFQSEKSFAESGAEDPDDLFLRLIASELHQMCSQIRQETKANMMVALADGMRKQAALSVNRMPQPSHQDPSPAPSSGAGTSHSVITEVRASPIFIKEEHYLSE